MHMHMHTNTRVCRFSELKSSEKPACFNQQKSTGFLQVSSVFSIHIQVQLSCCKNLCFIIPDIRNEENLLQASFSECPASLEVHQRKEIKRQFFSLSSEAMTCSNRSQAHSSFTDKTKNTT